MSFSAILIQTALKGFVILSLATTLIWFMRKSSAARRHLIWSLALLTVAVLPLLSYSLPVLNLPILAAPTSSEPSEVMMADQRGDERARKTSSMTAAKTPLEITSHQPVTVAEQSTVEKEPVRMTWRHWLLILWVIGFIGVLLPSLVGLCCLAVFRHRCKPLPDASLQRLVVQLSRDLKVRRSVSVMQQKVGSERQVPMVWGVFRPVLLLPVDCQKWQQRQAVSVLLHELAHVKRHDWLIQQFCAFVRAVHWFNPLAWLAVHRMALEREKACDDLVLNAGIEGPDYAQHLLSIARDLIRPRPMASAALAMAGVSRIEKRIRDILDRDRNRKGATYSLGFLGLVVLMFIAGPLAAMRLTDREPTPSETFDYIAGRVVDEEDNGLTGVSIVVTLGNSISRSTKTVLTVTSDDHGRFEITSIPRDSGPYDFCPLLFESEGRASVRIEDIYSMPQERKRDLTVVIPKGHSVSGTLADYSGRPASGVLVEIIPDWRETGPLAGTRDLALRRAAETDAQGRYAMSGIASGRYFVRAINVPSLQNVFTDKFTVEEDINELKLQLKPVTLPAYTQPIEVLGMKVINITDVVGETFDLESLSRGVMILDTGQDHKRYGIGDLKPGDFFFSVEDEAVHSVTDFVEKLLRAISKERGPDLASLPSSYRSNIRVNYGYRRVSTMGYNKQYMKLTKAEVLSLQKLDAELPKTPPKDAYPDYHTEKNVAGVILMSVKLARFAYMREHDRKPSETLDELLPYLKVEQDRWHNAQDPRIRDEFRKYDFHQWLKDNAILFLSGSDRPQNKSGDPMLGYCHTMLDHHGRTCAIYDNRVVDYEIITPADIEK